ncbi:MAG: hypothetical protein JWN86_4691 [Planctomycetota bacterium]|nr:hypothetical protein [Planctomycetota bacterium]
MRTTTRIASTILIFISSASMIRAQDGPIRIASRVKRALHPSTPVVPETALQAPSHGGDPYGFAAILNSYRASAGLRPLAYDPDLSAWASNNNAAQCRHGIGHHINPNCIQNCAWNHQSAQEVAQGWMRSPGHRRNMLSSSATRFGIAYGPGPYWTLNAR